MTLALAHRLALALPPALAHRAALRVMAMGWPVARRHPPAAPVTIAGVTFPNPLGLAAGFDKNGVALAGLSRLGFGHVEIGTVTLHPQAGNPGRTLFRLNPDRAVINRLGMPNDGADAVAARIGAWRARNPEHPMRIGASVGQNRDAGDVAADIGACVARLGAAADYVVVNLSSPNTAGLRDWQAGDRLARVLGAAAEARDRLPMRRPLLVKIAPDLEEEAEPALVARTMEAGIDGLVVCNTTIARPETLRAPESREAGGLSGAPLTDRALAQLRRIRGQAGDRLALVASGGVMTAADARARLEAGATLVQVMTGWIYRGPRLVDEILRAAARPEARAAMVSAGSPRSPLPSQPGRALP